MTRQDNGNKKLVMPNPGSGASKSGRKTPLELRKIRDNPDRKVRKMSMAPNEAFIVEESMLEDLCEASGEEARDGGNILL